MRAGAYDYLVKPFSPDHVQLLLARILEVQTLRRENRTLRRAFDPPTLLESASPAMHTSRVRLPVPGKTNLGGWRRRGVVQSSSMR
jgi:DNA-binding NtrC family response regulator